MRRELKLCVTFALVLGTFSAYGQTERAVRTEGKFIIGVVSGLKRPDGFTVEDLRTDVMKTSVRRRTYKREFNPFWRSSGPLAIYESNVGDAELNISPFDLMAEQMISRYGDKLNGKRLIVRQFSYDHKGNCRQASGHNSNSARRSVHRHCDSYYDSGHGCNPRGRIGPLTAVGGEN